MPNCKSFLVTEAEGKHVRRRARFQQHRDARCRQFFFLQGKTPKEINAILTETLGEHSPSYAIVKYWVAQFKRSDFSTCDAHRLFFFRRFRLMPEQKVQIGHNLRFPLPCVLLFYISFDTV